MDECEIPCSCGASVLTHIGQCGLTLTCPKCDGPVKVPDFTTLKRLMGDPYPSLNVVDKIVRACEENSPPFTGNCHGCQSGPASVRFPVKLDIMEERHLDGDGGIGISPLGKPYKKLAKGIEHWRRIEFPLLLCESCAGSYIKSRRSKSWSQFFGALMLVAILFLITWWMTNDTIIASLVGVGAFLGLLKVADGRRQQARRISPVDREWLSRIRWVDQALKSEDEYQVEIDAPVPYT